MTRNELNYAIAVYDEIRKDLAYSNEPIEKNTDIKADREIATKIFAKIAKQTKESSNIWVCIGAVKGREDDNSIEEYYGFVDLETTELQLIPSLEYGNFCRKNSVVLLEEYAKLYELHFSSGLEGYNQFRTLFFSNIVTILFSPDNEKIELNALVKHYKEVVAQYEKDGRNTIKNSIFQTYRR